ncbi:hypothetical protein C5167_049614 [Papaver somniferum]|uniref:PPM-type phosphatase domain-containing protein n=1 Tax=Papaver somniferum TaxID=3469 RepID=A0A4Y7KQG8_PAPSO|nr:protein phosphatase 2C 29-like [Papaver somniferum]RZC74135.1 hypothetical protein C5167_049614 [Papaver somniferum]
MGSGLSRLFPCLNGNQNQNHHQDLIYTGTEPLDETLGHSFCYVRSSARFLSPTNSDRISPNSQSLRLSPSHEPQNITLKSKPSSCYNGGEPNSFFKSISGATVSANTYTPTTILHQNDHNYEDAIDTNKPTFIDGFESSSSFSALPLQPIPRGGGGGDASGSGPLERSGFLMSGPIERGALSGPLDSTTASNNDSSGQIHFSAPLNGIYVKRRRRKKALSGIPKAFIRNLSSEKKRPWVVPVLNIFNKKDDDNNINHNHSHGNDSEMMMKNESSNVQWAHGKAGEDRVHVVVSEEHGWLFVGIYDGFNGPDAPEFLMGNLYRAVFHELEGLFWDVESNEQPMGTTKTELNLEREVVIEPALRNCVGEAGNDGGVAECGSDNLNSENANCGSAKKVTFQSDEAVPTGVRRGRSLWELLAEDYAEEGLDLSGSDRFAFSVDDAVRVSSSSPIVSRRSLLLSKLKHGFLKNKDNQGHSRRFFPWRYDMEDNKEKTEIDNRVEENSCRSYRKRRVGPVDHELVLRALSKALEVAELAYLDMTDKVLEKNPELALMGSCLLVVLMRDEDVYVMNLGDSRAVIGQYKQEEIPSSTKTITRGKSQSDVEGIVEDSTVVGEGATPVVIKTSHTMNLSALQLSTDHSTSIEEEVLRIKQEHPDDSQCIVNDRVKGRLKVTRAFGAGFLKKPKLNNALFEMFRNEYIGTAPYISCSPSLCHHKLGPSDQFLVLSSDGLYQYFSNQEVVTHVESFMEKFPDGDPAQHLIEELLFRAARKAGMDFHELLDIPQGDRRKYHDDITVMVISLEGRIWKSSGKYL